MGDSLFDKYSFLHFGSGLVAYELGIPKWRWMFFHVVFEMAENTEEGMRFINTNLTWWPGGKTRADHLINIVGDNLSAYLGWVVASKWAS